VELVYSERYESRSQAQKREYEIKQYTRKQKLDLIRDKGKGFREG
jgi:putative endonuclease